VELANVPTLTDLQDTSTYRCESGVPVFRPHRRYVKDRYGKPTDRVKYEVTDDDLYEICANSNATAEQDCHFPRQTIGHVRFDNGPEHQQPAKWIGHAINYRVGMMPNGAKVILADMITHKDHWDESRKFPYRSAEYNWKSKRIGGVARLLRDPALGLGTTKYEDDASFTCYAEAMMEPQAGQVPPGMDAGTLNPDEAVVADRMWSYFLAKNPGLATLQAAAPSGTNGELPEGDQKPKPEENEEGEAAKRGEGEQEGDEEDGDEGDEEGEERTPPGKKKLKKKKPNEDGNVSKNSAETVTVEAYAALEGEVTTLRESNKNMLKRIVTGTLDQLENVEKYEFDRAELETELLAATDDAARDKIVARVKKYNRKKDGSTVEVLQGGTGVEQLNTVATAGVAQPDGTVAPGATAEQFNKATIYARVNKVDFHTALAAVRAGK
jgi:hypothetical protein